MAVYSELSLSFSYRTEVIDDDQANSSNRNICVPLLNNTQEDGNIPGTLGFSFAIWLVLIVGFLVLRHFFYTFTTLARCADDDEEEVKTKPSHRNFQQKLTSWIFNQIRIDHVRTRCGLDAYSYLNFERYLILLMCVITLFSIVVILPINYNGRQHKEDRGFPRTTLSNIHPNSDVLWVHTLFSVFYVALTGLVMFVYVAQLGKYRSDYSTSSLLIHQAPLIGGVEDICQHFEEAELRPTDVQLVYNVSKLIKLQEKLDNCQTQLKLAQNVQDECNEEAIVHLGYRKLIFCCDPGVNARIYYQDEYQRLCELFKAEKEKAMEERLPILFVTMSSQAEAVRVVNSYRLCKTKPSSSLSAQLMSYWWRVSSAPFPSDIIWGNLSTYGLRWYARWIALNFFLLILLFFFTTPSIALSSINTIRLRLSSHNNSTRQFEQTISSTSPVVTAYIPILLLLLFSSLMPLLVAYSTYLESHWTRSYREQIIMRKTFIFLLLMLIILPSLSLTSLQALAASSRSKGSLKEQLQCAILPGNGAFFIGYIISATFIGTGLEWIRIPVLVSYLYLKLTAKCSAQRAHVVVSNIKIFPYGIHYSFLLAVFAMMITFSISCPIIAPFGLLYLLMKFYADKYNIYNVYDRSSLNGQQFLHRSAVNFVMVGAFLLQFCILCYVVLRRDDVGAPGVFAIVLFSLTVFIWICSMFLESFSYLMPTIRIKLGKYITIFENPNDRYEAIEENLMKGSYIPAVLAERESSPVVSETYQSLQDVEVALKASNEM